MPKIWQDSGRKRADRRPVPESIIVVIAGEGVILWAAKKKVVRARGHRDPSGARRFASNREHGKT